MAKKVSVLIFVGAGGPSAPEQMVAGAQAASALDTVERALAEDWCEEVIVSTASPSFARCLADMPVTVELDRQDFHFGRQLVDLIHRHKIERALYIGGGSGPLLTAAEFASLGRTLLENDEVVITNNFFSTDFAGFSPASAITRIDPPAIDNNLAWLLHYDGGLERRPLDRTPGTQLDIDTPADLMILQMHPQLGPHTAAFLRSLDLDLTRLQKAMAYLTEREAEIVVAGRVGSHVWARLETDLACRKRIYAEERGMRASGREENGLVRSLLAYHLEVVGPRRFFADLVADAQAVFLDSRVIFNHLKLGLSAADRFWSDLLEPGEVGNATAREFTAAARDAGVPVLMGGHSLVSGGLLVLIDVAWQKHDTPAGPAPA
ncbi:MAG: hypothetical protein M0Z94_03950 [Dehalococcoidales bacterium]|nr:hypothetical protein [Dehalococcoidales bacterium]